MEMLQRCRCGRQSQQKVTTTSAIADVREPARAVGWQIGESMVIRQDTLIMAASSLVLLMMMAKRCMV